VRAAQEQQADLIVLGSRERRGPSILVNFTEDTVLHAAPCDVLAVRIARPPA
jgi:universal stress protein A